MPWINHSPVTKAIVDVELSFQWGDLLSKSRRVERRLKKAFLSMVSHIDDELLEKSASPTEVLVACGVAVWQGYWYSSAPDVEKKKALDAFALFLFNIVLNEGYLLDNSLRTAMELHDNLEMELSNVEEKFRYLFITRTNEYTTGALAFINGEHFPVTLARTLSRNLLLPEKQPVDEERRSFGDAKIMFNVALPFVNTFSIVMKQFQSVRSSH